MSEIFMQNVAIIRQRWPHLYDILTQQKTDTISAVLVEGLSTTLQINGIQLTSRHDRHKEAFQQANSVPENPVLHLYGTGLGDLQIELLKRSELVNLHIHILNETLFALVLHLLDQQEWLNDPRVELSLASAVKEIQLPFFALPAELLLVTDQNSKIRDRLVAEIELSYVNQRFQVNEHLIQAQFRENEGLLCIDPDVAVLFNSYSGKEAYVLATGPTLELHYKSLTKVQKRKDRPVFICVDTALRPLLENGITPDFVISLDNTSHQEFPDVIPPSISLIYFPMVQHKMLLSWPGLRYAAYTHSQMYDQINAKIPKARLYANGTVLHPAVDFAVKLGVKTVTLFGADFSFPRNKTHSGWDDGVLGESFSTAKHWVLNGEGQRVKTLLNFRSYLCGLERYVAQHPEVHFYNTSRMGAAIDGTDYHPEYVL